MVNAPRVGLRLRRSRLVMMRVLGQVAYLAVVLEVQCLSRRSQIGTSVLPPQCQLPAGLMSRQVGD